MQVRRNAVVYRRNKIACGNGLRWWLEMETNGISLKRK